MNTLLEKPLVTLADAATVAELFLTAPEIRAVDIFGSTARDGQGHDLDIILVTDEYVANHFLARLQLIFDEWRYWKTVMSDVDDDFTSEKIGKVDPFFGQLCTYHNARLRMQVAQAALSGNFYKLRLSRFSLSTGQRHDEIRNLFFQAQHGMSIERWREGGYQIGVLAHRPLDVFVFSNEWRHRLPILQASLPHKDPEFMRNIARDARRYDQTTRTFWP